MVSKSPIQDEESNPRKGFWRIRTRVQSPKIGYASFNEGRTWVSPLWLQGFLPLGSFPFGRLGAPSPIPFQSCPLLPPSTLPDSPILQPLLGKLFDSIKHTSSTCSPIRILSKHQARASPKTMVKKTIPTKNMEKERCSRWIHKRQRWFRWWWILGHYSEVLLILLIAFFATSNLYSKEYHCCKEELYF